MPGPTEQQYQTLLVFRTALRRYLAWSSEAARQVGLTGQQGQLLLAVRAHPGPTPPSIRELADHLMLRHHSVVGLANRVVALDLVERCADEHDQRVVRLRLTPAGRELVQTLGAAHLEELQRVAERMHLGEEVLEMLSRDFSRLLGPHPHG